MFEEKLRSANLPVSEANLLLKRRIGNFKLESMAGDILDLILYWLKVLVPLLIVNVLLTGTGIGVE